jgi:hypothetical protein
MLAWAAAHITQTVADLFAKRLMHEGNRIEPSPTAERRA